MTLTTMKYIAFFYTLVLVMCLPASAQVTKVVIGSTNGAIRLGVLQTGGGATNGIQQSSGFGTNTTLYTPTINNGMLYSPVLSQATLSNGVNIIGSAPGSYISIGGANGLSNVVWTVSGSNDLALRAGGQTNDFSISNGVTTVYGQLRAAGITPTANPAMRPVLNVTLPPFNADPTGSADAVAAIQSAIDTAVFTNGSVKSVYIPAGSYKCSSGVIFLRGNVAPFFNGGYSVFGDPNNTTKLFTTSLTNGIFRYDGTNDTRALLWLDMHDLYLVGGGGIPINTNCTSVGLDIRANITIWHNQFKNMEIDCFKSGIAITGSVWTTFSHITLWSNWWTGINSGHNDACVLDSFVASPWLGATTNVWTNTLAGFAFYTSQGEGGLGFSPGAGTIMYNCDCGDYRYFTYNWAGCANLTVQGGEYERINEGVHLVNTLVKTTIIGQQCLNNGAAAYYLVCTNRANEMASMLNISSPNNGGGGSGFKKMICVYEDAVSGQPYAEPYLNGPALAQPAVDFIRIGGGSTNAYWLSTTPLRAQAFGVQFSGKGALQIGADRSSTNTVQGLQTVTANTDKYGSIMFPSYGANAVDTYALSAYSTSGGNIVSIGGDSGGGAPGGSADFVRLHTSSGDVLQIHNSQSLFIGDVDVFFGGAFNGLAGGVTNSIGQSVTNAIQGILFSGAGVSSASTNNHVVSVSISGGGGGGAGLPGTNQIAVYGDARNTNGFGAFTNIDLIASNALGAVVMSNGTVTATGSGSNYFGGDVGIAGNLYVGGGSTPATNLSVAGNITAYSLQGSNAVYAGAGVSAYASNVFQADWSNGMALAVNATNGDTRASQRLYATNGFALQGKVGFNTNYTITKGEQVFCCWGTNQVLTLPFCAASNAWVVLSFTSTNIYGSFWVTNANGSQTIGDGASLAMTNNGAGAFRLINDGNSWWKQ